jgi:hypothetical protein
MFDRMKENARSRDLDEEVRRGSRWIVCAQSDYCCNQTSGEKYAAAQAGTTGQRFRLRWPAQFLSPTTPAHVRLHLKSIASGKPSRDLSTLLPRSHTRIGLIGTMPHVSQVHAAYPRSQTRAATKFLYCLCQNLGRGRFFF